MEITLSETQENCSRKVAPIPKVSLEVKKKGFEKIKQRSGHSVHGQAPVRRGKTGLPIRT